MTKDTPYTLQDFPLPASIVAVKASIGFGNYDGFYQHMLDSLPQNSPETRRRYANLIGKRYFPGLSLNTLLPRIWQAYQDEKILIDLMRVLALEAEPVIARFVLDKIWPLSVGQVFDEQVSRTFIQETYGAFKVKSHKRLILTVRHLGFLGRYDGELVVEQIPAPVDAFLLLLHDRLAPTPRIVRLSEILETNWWRLAGFKTAEALRRVLRDAEVTGLIARYAKVDQLEQVTTRFSRDEYVAEAKRL
ncbi:MAG: hypothetical protein ACYTEQ_04195 [Planctomycetota bacterium]|jgi:hypothetical protein